MPHRSWCSESKDICTTSFPDNLMKRTNLDAENIKITLVLLHNFKSR